MKTFNSIEIRDAAITVVNSFSSATPEDRATWTTTNERSPICVRPEATVMAVRRGYRKGWLISQELTKAESSDRKFRIFTS